MQTKDQHGKRPKDWKVIAAVATASALGISGLALAGPSDGSIDPDPINLRDRTSITEVTTVTSVPTTLAEILDAGAENSLDSPFDGPGILSVSSVSADSPDAPAPSVVSAASADSPDAPPPPPPASADSASADSAASFDNSADS
jgi:hypothetical protein